MPPPAVVFYVSGHGFGHAVRQAEIIRSLLTTDPSLRILVRTSAPRWLFTRDVPVPVEVSPGEFDTGVVQLDGLHLDARASVQRALAFHRRMAPFVAAEAAMLRRTAAALVVSDAPAAPCAAAAAAGVPAVVCSNFTWDWIYGDYATLADGVPELIAILRRAYEGAEQAWRLPLHGGFESFRRIADVPFVARRRRAGMTPADVRTRLGLPHERPLVLVSFGGYGARDIPLDRIDCVKDWGVVVTGPADAVAALPAGILTLPETRIYASGLQYQDLLGAVDVVLSKPGYGIISDCLANGVALLYTSRGRFAEYDVLVREIPRYLRCRYLDLGSVLNGRWREALEGLAAQAPAPERPASDGAEVVSRWIRQRLGCSAT